MDFNALLLKGQSKKTTQLIVTEICKHPKKMEDLMQLLFNDSALLKQRSAYPFSFIIEKQPKLIAPYYELLLAELIDIKNHPAIARNILRSFQFVSLPKKYEGTILNHCFKLLNDNSQSIAIQVYSISIINKLSEKYPDIIPELEASIRALIPYASAGVKSRGNKILKQLTKK